MINCSKHAFVGEEPIMQSSRRHFSQMDSIEATALKLYCRAYLPKSCCEANGLNSSFRLSLADAASRLFTRSFGLLLPC